MALEATHIRFALDLKDALDVVDVNAYVSGSVYPDSRYVTGIDRLATNPKDYLIDPMFRSSDFHRGWLTHLLADDVQGKCMKVTLPETFEGDGQESWIKRTAIKILQDIEDVQKFDIAQYLPGLVYVENPNGEDLNILRGYNQIFPTMYAHPDMVTLQTEWEIWRQFGIGDELANKVKVQAEEYRRDSAVIREVGKLYDAMVDEGRTSLSAVI